MGDGAPRNPHLQRLEREAYTAVIRALAATQMDWSRERLMTEIRRELNISTEDHFVILEAVMDDAEITAIRDGTPLPVDSTFHQPLHEGPHRRPSPKSATRTHGGTAGRPGGKLSVKSMGGAAAASGAERRGPGRPSNRRLVHASGEPAAPVRKRGKHRSSGVASGMQVNELIGRTIWRHWPMEQVAWAKGVITDYKPATDEHTVVYDISTPDESWEEINLSNLRLGVDYELAQDAPGARPPALHEPPPRTTSLSRSQKRKANALQGATAAAQPPYPAGLLQEQLAAGDAGELETMREALESRARALMSGVIALAAPVTEYPDHAERLQAQLQDLAAREAKLNKQLAAVPVS